MKKFLALLLALTMVFALAACGGEAGTETDPPADGTEPAGEETTPAGTDSDLAYVQEKGTLVVGITEFDPMDYRDENGEWIGFDADMAKAFAESLGVTAEFQLIEWDNKVFELSAPTPTAITPRSSFCPPTPPSSIPTPRA